jgi:hypothetical protein
MPRRRKQPQGHSQERPQERTAIIMERPLNPVEMANYLRVSPRTLRTPCFHVGTQIRFMPNDVVSALQRRESEKKS